MKNISTFIIITSSKNAFMNCFSFLCMNGPLCDVLDFDISSTFLSVGFSRVFVDYQKCWCVLMLLLQYRRCLASLSWTNEEQETPPSWWSWMSEGRQYQALYILFAVKWKLSEIVAFITNLKYSEGLVTYMMSTWNGGIQTLPPLPFPACQPKS